MKFYYQLKSTRSINLDKDIFKSYPDSTYLVKISKLNRPALFVTTEEGQLVALVVLSKFGRHLKLCLLLVHGLFREKGIGNQLIQVIKTMFKDDFNDVDILYTVCPNQFNTDAYQILLMKNNFMLTTIKANGDIVYTYAKSVQKSDRKN